jgi:hypothetical protein
MFTQATKFEMEAADKGFDKVVKKWVLRLLPSNYQGNG